MKELKINKNDRLLILAPHPDDECIGCGGLLYLYSSQCDVVVMTDGSRCSNESIEGEMTEIRRNEFIKEMEYLGIKNYRLKNYRDGELIYATDCMEDVDFSEYDYIFLPWVDDNHPDHAATCIYAIEKIKKHNLHSRIYQYEVHVPFHDVDTYLNITNIIGEKEKLIQYHQSQLKYVVYDKKATALAKYRACSDNRIDMYYETYLGVCADEKVGDSSFLAREKALAKKTLIVNTLTKWLEHNLKDKKYIEKLLDKLNIHTVTIYGFSDIGRLLYQELLLSSLEIIDILDNRRIENNYGNHKVIKPYNGDRKVDCVIVTAVYEFEEIKKNLVENGYDTNILNIQELLS